MSSRDHIDAYRAQIASLPQASVLKKEDVENWLEGMIERVDRIASEAPAEHKGQNPSTDISWHIGRAGGIGSSEAGIALLHERKEHWHDVTLPGLVDQKLFRVLPDAPDEHMERGTYLEPLAQRIIHSRYQATTDHAARAAMAQFPGWPAYPWLQGNDDDILLIGGRRYLVDYKMPASVPDDTDLMQCAQLHHLWAKGHVAGVSFDGLLIANVTVPGATALVDSLKQDADMLPHILALGDAWAARANGSVGIKLFNVEPSPAFLKELVTANDRVWREFVMTGSRPRFMRRETVAMTPDEQEHGNALAERIARNKAVADYAQSRIDADRGELEALLADKTLEKKKQPFPLLSVGSRQNLNARAARDALQGLGYDPATLSGEGTYDIAALVNAAETAGLDIEAYRRLGPPDKKKIATALADAGLDAGEFSSTSFTVGLSRALKGDSAAQVRQIRNAAASMVEMFADQDLSLDGPEDSEQSTVSQTQPDAAEAGPTTNADPSHPQPLVLS